MTLVFFRQHARKSWIWTASFRMSGEAATYAMELRKAGWDVAVCIFGERWYCSYQTVREHG